MKRIMMVLAVAAALLAVSACKNSPKAAEGECTECTEGQCCKEGECCGKCDSTVCAQCDSCCAAAEEVKEVVAE